MLKSHLNAHCENESKIEYLSLQDCELQGIEAANIIGNMAKDSLPKIKTINIRGNVMFQLEHIALSNILESVSLKNN